jgi:uncharacterized protein (TIGR03545 family)
MDTPKNEGKIKKAKGPIRTGMLVPSLLLIGLVWAYFFFFFDSHLRAGIEFAAGRVHGAQVDVGRVKTSFWGASFEMNGLEVTDKEKPEQNLVKVGTIRLAMIWDALLRGKVAVEDASILDIQPWVKRSSPGWVTPPPPPSDPKAGLLARVQDQVVQQTRAQFNENFLGDIADVVGGADPKDQLKAIQGDLKAQAAAEKLEKELTAKKAEWEKRIKELPQPKDIQAIEAKIKALNLSTKNPIELAANLKKAKEILGEAEAKIKLVDQSQSQLTGDINTYTSAVAQLEKLVAQDVADLQKRLQIPDIDPKEFSQQLFMAQVEKRITGVRKYIEIARKYMPPKKTAAEKAAAKEEELVPPKRGEGKTYRFPITKGYPLFWLKKAAISSELNQSEWAGKASGEIIDLTTSPSDLGRPTRVQLQGDFPKQKLLGLDFQATLDHTKEAARESFKASIASFPVADQMFSNTPSVKLGLKEATGSGSVSGTLADQTVSMNIASKFDQPKFDFDAKSAPVKEILGAVLAGIPSVTMNAGVTGSWDKFNININSNLGQELSNGFQKQLQAKLGEAKAKLNKLVDEKVGPNKKKVQDALAGLTNGPGKLLSNAKEELNKALGNAKGAATPKAGGGGASPGNLLKGFGL